MRRFSLFILAALCGLPMAAAAQTGPTCNAYRPALVTVQPVFDDVATVTTAPMLDVARYANSRPQDINAENWPVGLETGMLYFQVDTDIFRIRQDKSAITCGQVKTVTVNVGFKDNTIYVAREFPRRSCPFNTVLGHEEKHAATDRQLLADYQDRIKGFFEQAAEQVGVIRNSSAPEVEKQITDLVNARIDTISQEMQAERRRRQALVDSPEEYTRVTNSCEGELMQIVNDRIALLKETYPNLKVGNGQTRVGVTRTGGGAVGAPDGSDSAPSNPSLNAPTPPPLR